MNDGTAHQGCDSGETLIEILITVAIMGIAFAAILGGFTTSIVVSGVHRQQASEQTLIRSYADAVEASPSWKGCGASPDDYAPAAVTFTVSPVYGGQYVATATAVQFWDSTSQTFKAACTNSTDAGLQQIRLQVQSNDLRAVEGLVVVKGCSGSRIAVGGKCP